MHNKSHNKVAATLVGAFLLALVQLSPAQAEDAESEVRAVIAGLQTSWNAADMDGYLAAYNRDDSMSLTYGNTVVQGWDALNALFRKSYPDEERMGKFSIDSIAVTLLGDDAAVAYGNFTHVFPEETIHGGYSHVLARLEDGRWIIQHERTSRGDVIAAD
ncbi:MAG: SgcJ/EcaC family oxidoreductase [Chromatocurvus sp.]